MQAAWKLDRSHDLIEAANPTQVRRAHAALATVLADAPHRRAWHRACAADHPDENVAADVESTVAEADRCGDTVDAIRRCERAARLTPAAGQRTRRLLNAATRAFELGRPDLGHHLLDTAGQIRSDLAERSRSAAIRSRFAARPPRTAELLAPMCMAAERLAAEGDRDTALDVLFAAAQTMWWTDPGPADRIRVLAALATLDAVHDDPRFGVVLAVAAPGVSAARSVPSDPGQGSQWPMAMAALAHGAAARAADLFTTSSAELRRSGRLGLLVHVHGLQAQAATMLGDWDTANQAATECLALARATGQPLWQAHALACDALIAALRGDTDRAWRSAADAELLVNGRLTASVTAGTRLARGAVLLNMGRHLDAYDTLIPMFDPGDAAYSERDACHAIGYLAEAAAHTGHAKSASAALAGYAPLFNSDDMTVRAASMLYAQALLADEDGAEARFTIARQADLTAWPWLAARIDLAWGTWLRRRRRVAESRAPLRSARQAFESLGASAWGARAKEELRATGADLNPIGSTVGDLLSPQELEIARLAASGLSNREIGQRMFLSPRTIGSHLYRIFPKLDVTARWQLGSRIGTVSGQPIEMLAA